MGNIFSGDSQTSISNNYVKPDTSSLINYYTKPDSDVRYAKQNQIPDLSTYAKQSQLPDLSTYAKQSQLPDLSTYAKTSELPDLSTYAKTSELNNKYAPTGNYLTYSDASKNTFNMDADYLSLGNKSKNEIIKLENNAINFKTSNVTFKNDSQSQVLGIQSGSDGTDNLKRDYMRIGRIDPANNGISTFIRFDTLNNPGTGSLDPTVRVRSPVIFSNEIRLGSDTNYYSIVPGDLNTNNCVYLKRTNPATNTLNQQVGKWCPN